MGGFGDLGAQKEGRGGLWALGELLGMVGFQASKYLFGFGRCIDRPDAFWTRASSKFYCR